MFLTLAIAGVIAGAAGDSIAPRPVGPRAVPAGVGRPADDTVPVKRRPKAVELSASYETFLRIHRIASYTTIPIFAAQAVIGQRLYNEETNGASRPRGLIAAHDAAAVALGALFAVNTVTGSLNWWETRHQEKGRAWRTIHAVLMLASDGGFAYAAAIAPGDRGDQASRDQHKNWAIGSAAVALTSYLMMLGPIRGDR